MINKDRNNKFKFMTFFVILACLCSIFIANYQRAEGKPQGNENLSVNIKNPNNIILNGSNKKTDGRKQTFVFTSNGYSEKAGAAPFYNYRFQYTYTININDPVKNLEIIIPVPHNIEEQQYISDLKIVPKPDIIEKGKYPSYVNKNTSYIAKDNENLSAKYTIPYLDSNLKVIVEGNVKSRTYNLKTAKSLNKNISPETKTTLEKYLQPQDRIESDDPLIKNIAAKIQGNTQEEIVENIYKYIQTNMNYRLSGCVGAKQAFILGHGQCCDYAAIMTAISRAKGIPARIVGGNVLINNRQSTAHNWVEIYYDKYGWVTYDPTIAALRTSVDNLVYNTSPDVKYLKMNGDSFLQLMIKSGLTKNNQPLDVQVKTKAYIAD